MTKSHVFVAMGNILNFRCDAWLLPTDRSYSVGEHWTDTVPGLADAVMAARSPEFAAGTLLAQPLESWLAGEPLPVLTAVPFQGVIRSSELTGPVQSFIRSAAAAILRRRAADLEALNQEAPHPPQATAEEPRPIPLLAMPLFGTAGGGAGTIRGDVMNTLLHAARAEANEQGVDVVLVLRDERDFALAQELRRRSGTPWWASLDTPLHQEAERLAVLAKAGQLVPFMGAGISVSAGAPTWNQLISRLAHEVELAEAEIAALSGRGNLDQASFLRNVFEEQGRSFTDAISAHVDLQRYGLAPALLSSLPSKEAITLNYDRLFEQASADAGRARTVIPEDSTAVSQEWLLKLHGSVTNPETIVLTRDDYLGYNTTRDALSALVKATLLTRHLLFVGFGLSDDHFHEIVYDVRRALPAGDNGGRTLATALTLLRDPLDERAWKEKLTLVPMSEQGDVQDAARTLEIFLDALLAYSTDSHSYLLAPEYWGALTLHEQTFTTRLRHFLESIPADERDTTGWRRLHASLAEMGLR